MVNLEALSIVFHILHRPVVTQDFPLKECIVS
jgi:hypothetical protein